MKDESGYSGEIIDTVSIITQDNYIYSLNYKQIISFSITIISNWFYDFFILGKNQFISNL